MSVECAARRRLGLDDYHCDNFEDTFFRHALKEIEEWQAICRAWYHGEPDDLRACAYYFAANLIGEKPCLDTATINRVNGIGSQETISSVIVDESFYQAIDLMPEAQILAGFPPSRVLTATGNTTSHALFVGCDQRYFDSYGVALLGSLVGKNNDITVHFHIFDHDEDRILGVVKKAHDRFQTPIRVSVEHPGEPTEAGGRANYYHAVRFVRLMEYLDHYKSGGWQIDTDFLFSRDPWAMFEALSKSDVGLWMMPARIEPYNHTPAGIFGLSNSMAAKRYIKLVSGYLSKLLRIGRLRWGTDQLALYMCMLYLRSIGALPAIAPVTKDMYGAFGSSSMIWPGKYAHGEVDLNAFNTFRTEAVAKLND
jgi:hypothetical protein